jgi:uncharacterized protein (TIGR00251 family)
LTIRTDGTAVVFTIKVQAGAKKTAIAGEWEDALKIKVGKKPEDGAANRECLGFLARTLEIPQKSIAIIKGEFNPIKVIRAEGVSVEVARKRLQP